MTAPAPKGTTVAISTETWRRLTSRKIVPGDSMEAVIRRLLDATERESAEASQG